VYIQAVDTRRPQPALPPERPEHFFATVHGTVFGDRSRCVEELAEGDEVLLLPDPPMADDPGVWVHGREGDLIGHLPPEIEAWLAPWLHRGGRVEARAVRVSGEEVPSWRRVLIEVRCG
jgi:hypothetical protein